MAVDPLAPGIVADHILWLRDSLKLKPTTPMDVIKLTYLSHGWELGWSSRPLINESIEAWAYGPVIPSLYHRYKSFGAAPIKVVVADHSKSFDPDQLETIEFVVDGYRQYSALQLSDLTHERGSPWDITMKRYGVGAIIPNKLIEEHFAAQIIEDVL